MNALPQLLARSSQNAAEEQLAACDFRHGPGLGFGLRGLRKHLEQVAARFHFAAQVAVGILVAYIDKGRVVGILCELPNLAFVGVILFAVGIDEVGGSLSVAIFQQAATRNA